MCFREVEVEVEVEVGLGWVGLVSEPASCAGSSFLR